MDSIVRMANQLWRYAAPLTIWSFGLHYGKDCLVSLAHKVTQALSFVWLLDFDLFFLALTEGITCHQCCALSKWASESCWGSLHFPNIGSPVYPCLYLFQN